MNVCVFIGRCWNQPSLFCRCCYCGTLQHVVEGWIQTQRSRAATQLYRIFSTWRLITWTLPVFRLTKTRFNWVDLWFHASQLRTTWKENLLNVFLFFPPGDSCVGHDFSPAALVGFGCWGELALPAASPGDTHTVPHLPAESGAAAGDGNLPRPTQTALALSARGIGTWHART